MSLVAARPTFKKHCVNGRAADCCRLQSRRSTASHECSAFENHMEEISSQASPLPQEPQSLPPVAPGVASLHLGRENARYRKPGAGPRSLGSNGSGRIAAHRSNSELKRVSEWHLSPLSDGGGQAFSSLAVPTCCPAWAGPGLASSGCRCSRRANPRWQPLPR